MRIPRRRTGERGSSLVEFAIVTFTLILVILACIEFDRMVLVYTALAHSARAGARYAIVHGSDRTSTGDAASGPSDSSAVVTVVRNFAGTGMLTAANVSVTVTYPTNNKPGSQVIVTATYPYDPFTVLPLSVNLYSSTRGVIVF